uniref:Uncharacterized protein n=1 Tax=Arundo donax TaxID=35708 RepID=A0A0A9HD10_ARUDO
MGTCALVRHRRQEEPPLTGTIRIGYRGVRHRRRPELTGTIGTHCSPLAVPSCSRMALGDGDGGDAWR